MKLTWLIGIPFLTASKAAAAPAADVPFTDLPYNFTFTALNTTLPNANATGAPLVLGQNGATSGLTFHVTSTYASFPYNDYPLLRLANGTLRALSNGGWDTNATAPSSGGGTLGWVTSTIYTQPAVQIYSAVAAPADRFPRLAVYGNPGLWSLCLFTGPRAQTNVVFNMSGNIPPSATKGFDPAACYTVDIYIVQA